MGSGNSSAANNNQTIQANSVGFKCAQEASAAAAPYWSKAKTPPSAGNLVGGGALSVAAHIAGASNPVSITLGFLNVFRENIGNGRVARAKFLYVAISAFLPYQS